MMNELQELWLQRNLERRIIFIQPTPEKSTAVIAHEYPVVYWTMPLALTNRAFQDSWVY